MRIITATAEQKGISKICPGGVSPRPATQSSGKQSPKNIWKIRDKSISVWHRGRGISHFQVKGEDK